MRDVEPHRNRVPWDRRGPARRGGALLPIGDLVVRTALFLALLSIPLVSGTATAPRRRPLLKRVAATWYGAALHGRLTAWHFHGRPGTRFDKDALTCAHRSAPFGSKLRVHRRGNSVVVTVTDRGPEPWTGSDLDLSEAAAGCLGMLRVGRDEVWVEVVR